MAGHSKWSKVKRVKESLDVKRGRLFSKLSKEIMIAARSGGRNFHLNPRLRAAVQSARSKSMPNENIVRAIARGGCAGSTVAAAEQALYEGYGAGGAAILVEAATENRNRTAAVLRSLFSKKQGTLGGPGSASHLFLRKGQILIPRGNLQEEWLLEVALQAGAEDLVCNDEFFTLFTSPDRFHSVAESLIRDFQVPIESQQLTFLPRRIVNISDLQTASYVLQLCNVLQEHEDVLRIHSNFNIPERLLGKVPLN
ncbi:MAG: YebC/PmpR family DNA-binding transcriptional regulator [Candidatus Xiphinematobacter sp.]|nr:MAG: YebC/PmpR family DNA-binding transcriptional regulator [Candidatus Xiphinematobacter sp.]QQY11472.1 MAG: YebC/PmpR family DNA-binding transcriptional regulator [Candidatus Xiphinematobacter sp.]